MSKIKCGTCGCWVKMTWAGFSNMQWSGGCDTCGTIMFATKDEVMCYVEVKGAKYAKKSNA